MNKSKIYTWVKALDGFPVKNKPESLQDVTFRTIDNKEPVTRIWQFHENFIELNNETSICGDEIPYSNIEWLKESEAYILTEEEMEAVVNCLNQIQKRYNTSFAEDALEIINKK